MKKKNVKSVVDLPVDGEMTDAEMANILLGLKNSTYWQAIVRYFKTRRLLAEDSLKSIDAFKEPTKMARTQGILMGLNDLVDFILLEEQNRIESAKEKERNGQGE